MREIVNKRFHERYVEETLSNGLHVVLWEKPDFEKSYFMMATPFGALDLKQIDDAGNEFTYPAGIAHFLEHKMFEDESQDVMDRFSQMGASVNAFTSYHETCYYFTTSQQVKEPLELLMDFVSKLSITDESVEKEKGIIISELHMYQQMSDTSLLMEMFRSLFQKHPMRFDIGGDDESVMATTKEMLMNCFAHNYHPQNMLLVGVTSKDVNELLALIKANQAKKQIITMPKMKRVSEAEPPEPARKSYTFHMDVSTAKHALGYKLNGITDVMKRKKMEWALALVMDAAFTTLNPDYQNWLNAGIINDFFGYEVDIGEDYGYLMLYGETNEENVFLKLIQTEMANIKEKGIDLTLLEQLKRRYFGQMVRSLNRFEEIAVSFMRSYFAGMDYFDSIDLVLQIEEEDIQEALKLIDLNQLAIVHLYPKQSI